MLKYPRSVASPYRPVPVYKAGSTSRCVAGLALIGTLVGLAAITDKASKNQFATQQEGVALSAASSPPEPPATIPPIASAKSSTTERQASQFSYTGVAGVTLDFAPRSTGERMPIQLIRHAKRSVKLQAFTTGTPDLQDAIRSALTNGATVEIMVDQSIYTASKDQLKHLSQAGARIWINQRSGRPHDKTVIVDDQYVALGTINHSRNRKDSDITNTLLVDNPEVARIYLKHWDEHVASATNP